MRQARGASCWHSALHPAASHCIPLHPAASRCIPLPAAHGLLLPCSCRPGPTAPPPGRAARLETHRHPIGVPQGRECRSLPWGKPQDTRYWTLMQLLGTGESSAEEGETLNSTSGRIA